MDDICIKARDSRGTVRTMSLCLDESTRDKLLVSDDLHAELYRLSFDPSYSSIARNTLLDFLLYTDLYKLRLEI